MNSSTKEPTLFWTEQNYYEKIISHPNQVS